MKFSQISYFGALFALSLLTSHALANYQLVPDKATADCDRLGLKGEFELRKYEGDSDMRGRLVHFVETMKQLPVTQASDNPNYYSTQVRCTFGCDVSLNIVLDFDARSFEYKRTSRQRNIDELCRGEVKL